ncbi:hypothetical protein FHL15_008250 [Xylaria flabelliformis]|uniref:Uncharacterized protein n=1 Tax=Xylaria flabelliformis TaxID=2512241 RepID=A0A553HSC1_9PEZI|nr:hypothetical protein FHL15_008250 [Xylaria flabelliformis]
MCSYPDSETFRVAERGYLDDQPNLLTAKVLRFQGLQASKVEYLFAHPKAEVLEFHNCYWDIGAEPIHTKTRAIKFVETTINDDRLSDILCRFPKLRSLVYFRPSDEVDTCMDMLGRELAEHGQNLEHLELYNDGLMSFATPFAYLHMLGNLKTLEMDLELLIGFLDYPREYDDDYCMDDAGFESSSEEEEETTTDYEEEKEEEINYYAGEWSLVKLLPPSLEKLTLHIEQPKLGLYFDTYERFGAKFEELIMTAAAAAAAEGSRFDKLHWVSAPRLDLVAEKLRDNNNNNNNNNNKSTTTGWVLVEEHIMTRTTPLGGAQAEADAAAGDARL